MVEAVEDIVALEKTEAYQALKKFCEEGIYPRDRGNQTGPCKGWFRYRGRETYVHGSNSVTCLWPEEFDTYPCTWFLTRAFRAMKRVGIETIEDLVEMDPRKRRDKSGRKAQNYGPETQELACLLRNMAMEKPENRTQNADQEVPTN